MASSSDVKSDVQISNKINDERPEKFKGVDFKRWQQKMQFYLTTLNLAHILKEECPKLADPDSRESLLTVETWKQSDFLCRNYILNRLDDTLYDIYSAYSTAKEVWDSLEKKYKMDDAGAKKFVIGKFLKYVMVDSKPVTKQVEEIQILMHELHGQGCSINEHFQVGAIIEKLPSS
ncbi:uncharacterized protein [Coffea arabica]|uniref:Retrovirus-related Pol polyprotein from transposon TNT 1-94 n=1 Tax=Coffea arabica TaxID=13443 RepID=A0A6P6S3X7_COFAR|nr:uncharacterized protein LOC113687460 [Coffea arabica]